MARAVVGMVSRPIAMKVAIWSLLRNWQFVFWRMGSLHCDPIQNDTVPVGHDAPAWRSRCSSA